MLPRLLFLLKDWQFSVYDIDFATPVELKPYLYAMELENEHEDRLAWNIGLYTYIAHSKVLSAAFSDKKHIGNKKDYDYPEKPISLQTVEREMTKEEFDALPPEEKEKVFMQVVNNMMAPAIEGLKRKKEQEDEENG